MSATWRLSGAATLLEAFSMALADYQAGIHGADESLGVADLVEMTEFHLRALQAMQEPVLRT